MATFDRPTSRFRAVYGRNKGQGLLARRKALLAMASRENPSSESSDSKPESTDDEEKENQNPSMAPREKSLNQRNLRKKMHTSYKHSSSRSSSSSSESEDEVIKPLRWRTSRLNRSTMRHRAVLVEESEEDIDDLDNLVILMEKTLKVEPGLSNSIIPIQKEEKKSSSYQALLDLCEQEEPKKFSAFLNELQVQCKCDRWKKFGEASYSEVYGLIGTTLVVKIIPLFDDDKSSSEEDKVTTSTDACLPDRSLASDVHREIEMTRALAKVSSGFVRMYSAQVVQGLYPSRLLEARVRRRRELSTEETSTSPESFHATQRYAALVLQNGGQDLESFEDLTWRQAASIFCQVVNTLSQGEEMHQFEVGIPFNKATEYWARVLTNPYPPPSFFLVFSQHRDLHWGNVVINHTNLDAKESEICPTLIKGKEVEQLRDASQSNAKATIIDYTLSRATIGKTLIAYNFQDETLFQGHGDMQFDIYRQMKQETKGDWSAFHPHTNILVSLLRNSRLCTRENHDFFLEFP